MGSPKTVEDGSGERSFKGIARLYKKNAERRGLSFELTKEQLSKLFKQNCFYCGVAPENHHRQANKKLKSGEWSYSAGYTYNGLDRRDNERGYTEDNVVPCCAFCNRAKSNRTYDEFMAWVRRLTFYQLSLDSTDAVV